MLLPIGSAISEVPQAYNRSLLPETPRRRLLKRKDCREFTGWVVTELAIQLSQREIQWL
jgi:hypothetical protein